MVPWLISIVTMFLFNYSLNIIQPFLFESAVIVIVVNIFARMNRA